MRPVAGWEIVPSFLNSEKQLQDFEYLIFIPSQRRNKDKRRRGSEDTRRSL